MAMNIGNLMKMKERLSIFSQQHPKVGAFFQDVGAHAVEPGSIVEMKVTDPAGKNYVMNIRLTPEDIETIRMLQNQK